jgi:hypothetical protein
MNYISDDFNLLEYTALWTGYKYKDKILGLVGQMPKDRTGYTTISSYFEYDLVTKEGCKEYWFSDEPLNFNF